MRDRSTITLRQEVKDRLALAKGDRSWDEFLGDVANERLDDAIVLAERRLDELRKHKAHAVSLAKVEQDIGELERREHEIPQARPRRKGPVERADPPKRAAGDPRPRRDRGPAGA